jgi:hypothetical protein
MPLNLEPRSADFTPYLKFNGKAGRWYTRNDIGEEVEITDLTAIFDLALIKTGWIHFEEGMPPQAVWDTNAAVGPKPTNLAKAKRGFAVNIFAPKIGGLREFSSTSNGAVIAVRDLYDQQFEKSPERHSKVPVVRCEKILPVKSKYGTNYEPVLKIIKWVDRPEGLPQGSPHIIEPKPAAAATPVDDFEFDDKPALEPRDDLDDDIPF